MEGKFSKIKLFEKASRKNNNFLSDDNLQMFDLELL